VVAAHIRRIEAVDPQLNAVVVCFFDQALNSAASADEARAHRQPLRPLHGLPITVKEMFDVAGSPTTAGLSSLARTSATADAPLVHQLRKSGAIILGKTNVPQFGMLYESDNPLYGRTNNPWNLNRSPGGSSGGEAAIIAARGSALGLGSDGGGSIRQPAHSCGICGLKPTSHRLPMAGHFTCPNWHSDWVQPGPLARNVADLRLGWTALTAAENAANDSTCSPGLPDESAPLKNLRIGFYVDDGFFSPAPAVRRAVEQAGAALRQAGAEIEDFHPPALEEALRIYFGLFLADRMRWARQQARGSRIDWRIKELLLGAQLPGVCLVPIKFLNQLLGQRYLTQMSDWCAKRALTAAAYHALVEQQAPYRSRFLREFHARKLDAILCPPNALPAMPHGAFCNGFTGSYTMLYNLLGLPAGVVPVTRVTDSDQTPRNCGLDLVRHSARAAEYGSLGLPIGVQVVTAPGTEQTTLAIMALLEQALKSHPDYPDSPNLPAAPPRRTPAAVH
jgi:fatty acid amide hydrolase